MSNQFQLLPIVIPETSDPVNYYSCVQLLLENGISYSVANYEPLLANSKNYNKQWLSFPVGIAQTPEMEPAADSLSVCIICKNAEKTLAACLSSVADWADELLLVDCGSSDSSIDIAKQYTNHVFQNDWNENYAEQRNYLISKVRTDWFFMIDTDEIVQSGFPEDIKRLLAFANRQDLDCVWLSRKWIAALYKPESDEPLRMDYYSGHPIFWPDPQARIARMAKSPEYVGDLHERLRQHSSSAAAEFASGCFALGRTRWVR